MHNQQMPDFSQIMKIAQQVASKIDPPSELKSGKVLTEEEMNKAISSLAKSVTQAVTPEMFESLNKFDKKKKGNSSLPIKNKESSKISFVEDTIPEETDPLENISTGNDLIETETSNKKKKIKKLEL